MCEAQNVGQSGSLWPYRTAAPTVAAGGRAACGACWGMWCRPFGRPSPGTEARWSAGRLASSVIAAHSRTPASLARPGGDDRVHRGPTIMASSDACESTVTAGLMRRLAPIISADVEVYRRVMGEDGEASIRT